MQNPAFWARLGLLWCAFVFAACWCASAKGATPVFANSQIVQTSTVNGTLAYAGSTSIVVTNSLSVQPRPVAANDSIVHAIPTLDGFGLFILAALLGVAAFWMWRRRQ